MSSPFHITGITTQQVPTKVDDNDNSSYASLHQDDGAFVGQDQGTKFDAFKHYSSDITRLKTLLLIDDEDDVTAVAAVNHALMSVGLNDLNVTEGSGSQDRKTRVSFELHPSLVLCDLFDEVEEDIRRSVLNDEVHEEQQYEGQ